MWLIYNQCDVSINPAVIVDLHVILLFENFVKFVCKFVISPLDTLLPCVYPYLFSKLFIAFLSSSSMGRLLSIKCHI